MPVMPTLDVSILVRFDPFFKTTSLKEIDNSIKTTGYI
ncbi:hypothetical protein HCH_03132 [Hahella chejuensis KCTC 2396]|uniref:Uncharacterized protein n=1 Tax=Hahella chejuensis (strain KCTC 2396) TaxID=349521 RepID=Q2SHH8_HAHCH|nr:hypothetical protein HCH_03132 [Hahella chejuensis KCTC 2396]